MKLIIAGVILLVIVGVAYFALPRGNPSHNISSSMILASLAFGNNGDIPQKYTCDGGDTSPPLSISGVPTNTKGLALIVDDPDAPAGDWVHWTIWNITPEIITIPEGVTVSAFAAPTAVGASLAQQFVGREGVTDFSKPGYGGPCPPRLAASQGEAGPPSGTHRYFFKLYALDTLLTLPQTARKADIEKAMQGHILDKAELIGLYKRQ